MLAPPCLPKRYLAHASVCVARTIYLSAVTMPPPTRPAAGWFPDPWGAATVRYWDGQHWTPYVAEAGAHRASEAPHVPEIPLRSGLLGLAVLLGGFAASLVVSVVLFALLMLGHYFGLIEPNAH